MNDLVSLDRIQSLLRMVVQRRRYRIELEEKRRQERLDNYG